MTRPAAYRAWTATRAVGQPMAIEGYRSALDRAERAADTCSRLMSRLRQPIEIGPAPQMAPMPWLSGTSER
jgi:hypothetical protein